MCGKFSAIGLCQAVFICIMKLTNENKLKYAQQKRMNRSVYILMYIKMSTKLGKKSETDK